MKEMSKAAANGKNALELHDKLMIAEQLMTESERARRQLGEDLQALQKHQQSLDLQLKEQQEAFQRCVAFLQPHGLSEPQDLLTNTHAPAQQI